MKFYWCSVGFTPEDAVSGNCGKYDELEYGCHSCPDWKQMSETEISNLPRQTSLLKENPKKVF